MMLRNLALKLPLLMVMLVGFASQGLARTGLAYNSFDFLHEDDRHKSLDQRVEEFITDVRAGDRRAFKYVIYETLEAAVVRLKREADEYPATRTVPQDRMMKYLVATTSSDEERARAALVRATLPGIFNMDPRVRLVATDWLRGLRPDPTMQRAVKLAVGVDVEVIRYDHRRGEFVFRAPRILETVASPYEYYREKDLDWPTSFQVGGPGPNNDEDKLYQNAPQLRDGPKDNTTTGLNARRWGDFAPRYDPDRGYVPLTEDEQHKIMNGYDTVVDGKTVHVDGYADVLHKAEEAAQARYPNAGIWAPDLDQYRHYPLDGTRDEDGLRQGAQLLMEQYGQQGAMVPLGQGDKYVYLDRLGHLMLGNPWTELTKLDMYITRKVWWDKIRAGQRNVMTYLSKDTFSTLFRSIDGEVPEVIPMLSFATAKPMVEQHNAQETDRVADVLITGLHQNPVLSNKYVMLRALIDIYADRYGMLDTTPATRDKINVALWEFRRMANRLDYAAGRVLAAQSITVGKRPANDWVPIQPINAAVTEIDTVKDLGFRLPNDEIRASGYRLITANATVAADPQREPRINIDDLYNSRFYAYRQGNGSIITWYNNREQWIARASGQDITANAERRDSDWIYNYDQMERAQKLIDSILTGDPEVLKNIEWPDVESAIILTLKRVQIMYEKESGNASSTVVTTFMDQLRNQDVIIKNPKYDDDPETYRDRMFVDEYKYAREKNPPKDTFSEEKREAIKQAALGGLFNKDPRIRLTCTHFLRRLGPDESMLEAVVKSRSIVGGADPATLSPETTDHLTTFIDTNIYERMKDKDFNPEFKNRYMGVIPDNKLNQADITLVYDVINPTYTIEGNEYQMGMKSKLSGESGDLIRYYGEYQIKSPGEELDKLYRFIQRRAIVRKIKRGDINAIVRMSRADFGILSEFIDDEYAVRVPFISFHTEAQDRSAKTALPSRFAVFDDRDVPIIARGVDSSNFLVQKGTAEFLVQFYNFYTGFDVKSDVKSDIRDSMYFYKHDDIVVEEFVLAFEGENPDGRAVIMAGTPLSRDLNPGGERVYRTLPDNILMDIRDAVLDETYRLPDALRNILGMITVRATDATADTTYTSRGQSAEPIRRPEVPQGMEVTPPTGSGSAGGTTTTAAATTTTAAPATSSSTARTTTTTSSSTGTSSTSTH